MIFTACYGSFASDSKEFVKKLGIMTGDENGNFSEEELLTREQFAKIVVKMIDPEFIAVNGTSPFSDVAYQSWASGYIKRSNELGFFSGFPDGSFRPSDYLLSEQICKVMLLFLGYENLNAGVSWAESQISTAKSKGLLNDAAYEIGKPVTRISMAQIVKNTLLLQKKDEDKYLITDLGYAYFEDAVIITDENLQSGYAMTSAGMFKKGEFSAAYLNRKGNLIVNKKNEIVLFLPSEQYFKSYVAKEILPDRMYVYDENKNELLLNLKKDITIYNGTTVLSYGQGFGTVSKGNNIKAFYDENTGNLEYMVVSEAEDIQNGRDYIIKSVIPDGLMVFSAGGDIFIKCDNDIMVYEGDIRANYQNISQSFKLGDKITLYNNNIGDISYMTLTRNVLDGPYTNISGSALSAFSISEKTIISRDGKSVSSSDIEDYDICYYVKQVDLVLAYSTKVTGVYQEALPNKDNVQRIILSGKTYEVGNSAAFNKLSSQGSLSYGDPIKILLDKEGKIADVIKLTTQDSIVGYLLKTSLKTRTDSDKNEITEYCSHILLTNGITEEYYSDKDYEGFRGQVILVRFVNGKAVLTVQKTNSGISGKFDWTKKTLGQYKISDNINIIDTKNDTEYNQAKGMKIFPERINGVSVGQKNILYIAISDNYITDIILIDLTNDLYDYGVLLKAEKKSGVMGIQGLYELNISGVYMDLTVMNKWFPISAGQTVKADFDSGLPISISPLTKVNEKIISTDDLYAYTQNEKYRLSDNILIYKKIYNTTNDGARYEIISKNSLDYKKDITAYYDKTENNGGRIRIIITE